MSLTTDLAGTNPPYTNRLSPSTGSTTASAWLEAPLTRSNRPPTTTSDPPGRTAIASTSLSNCGSHSSRLPASGAPTAATAAARARAVLPT